MDNKSRQQFKLTTFLLLLLPLVVLGSLQHEDDDLVFDDMDEEDTTAQQPLIHPSPISHKALELNKTPVDNVGNYEKQDHHLNKVERLWSLPDVTTTTGHVFKLKIPKQAFGGSITHYEVRGRNNKPLPRWLSFDEATFTLMGVPAKEDIGPHYVSVKAYGMANNDAADDVFTIQVIEKYQTDKHKDEKISCDLTKQTLMTLVLDVRFDDLKPDKKVKALEKLANHLGFHVSALSMSGSSLNDKEDNKIDNFTIISTGPGSNVKHRRRKDKHSTFIQWQVGCEGHLWKHQADLLKIIKKQTKDKTLTKTLHSPVAYWQVTTATNLKSVEVGKVSKIKHIKKKVKTESPRDDDLVRSRREIGSGDYGTNNDNDNDDYDENYEEYDDAYDDNERGVIEGEDDGDDNNESFTEIPPSKFLPSVDHFRPKIGDEEPEPPVEHPHRHHHGQGSSDWKPVEHINEDEIIPGIENRHETNIVTTSEMSTTAQETTLQTTPTTTETPLPSPSISSTSTTQPVYSTLNTTTIEFETSSMGVVSPETPTITLKTSITTETTTNEASITQSSSPSPGISSKSELDSDNVEESNRIDDFNTPITPIVITTTTIPLDIDTISPITFLPTTLFNPPTSTATTSDIVETSTIFTTVNNTTDQVTQSSSMLTTDQMSKTTTIIPHFDSKSSTASESEPVLNFTSITTSPASSVTPPVMTTIATETIPSSTLSTVVSESSTGTTSVVITSTVSTTTTTETPEFPTEKIEYEPAHNYPPQQEQRLPKVPITAGKPLSYIIPPNTFIDHEDGDTRNLRLALYFEGSLLKETHWLQFNNQTQEVYGLPLEKDVSVWGYELVASDRQGLRASDRLDVYVQQHRSSRSVNHEFNLYLKIENKRMTFPVDVDWELKIIKSLAELYDDRDTNQITVRSINLLGNDQAVFTWTNDSIPRTSKCPKDEINKLYHILVANKEGDPSAMLENILPPEIHVKKVTLTGLRLCDNLNNHHHGPVVVVPSPSSIPLPERGGESTQEPKVNNSPMPRNQVDHISAVVGQLLIFRVPKDTFYDPEDGSTTYLKLSLLTSDRNPIPPSDWLQFDTKNQEFYGVPMKVGRKEYQLIATDKDGASANDNLVVVVEPASTVKPSAEFTIKLGVNYKLFSQSAMLKKNFILKLRELFGDKDTNAISITSIVPAPGSNNTIVTWRNTTLPTAYCPNDEITRLSEVLFVKPDNKELTNRIERIMGTEFPVDQLTLTPMEICLGEFTRVHSHDSGRGMLPPILSGADRDDDDLRTLGTSQDDYLITFVLPAIIISAMLVLAGIIACVLYKRKRSGKMSVSGERDDERQTFKSKGIPVIFQDELEEKPDPGNKSPVILKEEKPPLPPPEYHQEKVDDGSDQPMLPKESNSEEPYQPPPPFARTSDNTRQNRPKPTPTYRKPPPYVPP
ncbi:dystroglycan isoform X1 [Chelonus insularis]|uniref:dystroglycan isoform X1 n=1 Tax=Chelonus insularis TaxID=460826 RepID=UPI00158B9FA8|nr:dystroglycan isoform X1 [Chelonus insularis]XP_034946403.1 dystroglycan isoform X1 [Chelonus insularis]XP_034946405.1 dystroglycan isoform X1 [Chelonus insularis]XP_034946406.1 dystroglycan isoform X1 [Chelonus insularis]